jgi:uncharacterized protein involved in exopolysaccharide biosynthesis
VWAVLAFGGLGVIYAVLAPESYTSSAKVVRETKSSGALAGGALSLPGGLGAGALSGLGVSLDGGGGGLTPQAFPEVLEGRKVRLAVVRDTFRFPDAERPMTFVEYANRPPGLAGQVLQYTLLLPWTLKDLLGEAIADAPVSSGGTGNAPPTLTEEEDEALETVSEMLSTSVNQESGLMRIAVSAGGARLAADLTESFVRHLTTRIREIRTEKVRERLQFVKGRFREAETELETAEDSLAQFLERNKNPNSAQLQFQRDRLERQVRFKEQLYSELQSQLTQTRLDLQRRQPVVTVVEEPVTPIQRSAPKRTLIVLLSVILGGILGIAAALFSAFLTARDEEDRRKLEEIKTTLVPERWKDKINI